MLDLVMKNKLINNYLPKDKIIKKGVICQICKLKLYLKDYKNKYSLKKDMLRHIITEHKPISLLILLHMLNKEKKKNE